VIEVLVGCVVRDGQVQQQWWNKNGVRQLFL